MRECNKSGDQSILEKLKIEKEEIKMAAEIMDELTADEKEYQQYLAREKFLMDEISKKRYAEIKRKELEDKVKEVNEKLMDSNAKLEESETKIKQSEAKIKQSEVKIKQSEEKLKESEEKAKESEEKVVKLIKELLKAGVSHEIISINTGSSNDEINKIKDELEKI